MPRAEIIDDVIDVTTEYRDRYAIKSIPGSRYDTPGHPDHWTLPLSWASCVALRGIFQERLEIGDELWTWAAKERSERIDPSMALRDAIRPDENGVAGKDVRLFEPQRAGVQWLQTTKRGLLGDPMGTGKTRQLLLAIPNDGWPALVITPNGVRSAWRDEATALNMPCEIIVLDGGTQTRKKQLEGIEDGQRALVIINWESVRTLSRLAPYGSVALTKCVQHGGENPGITDNRCEVHVKALNNIPWRTVIRDEAHRAKDPMSKQTRASWALQHADTVRYCWDATGTPVATHLGDLWAIMHGNSPQDFPRKGQFIDRYAMAQFNTWGGLDIGGVNPLNQEELFSFLDPRFRRVPKEILLPFLPAKVFEERICTMAKKQKDAYNDMAATMIAELETGVVVTTNPLAQYTRMLQFAGAYAEILDDGEVGLQMPSCKVEAMSEVLGDIGNESCAISMVSRQLLHLCEERLLKDGITFTSIHGGQSMDQRAAIIDDFQQRRVQVILLMAQSGGVGITLTTSPYLVRLQRSWSIIDNQQTEDRVHRIGSEQHKQVTIIDIFTEGTLEMARQIERLREKDENLNEILRDKETLKKFLFGQSLS
jgi:SNF2 family DNA or RNA helicase